MRATEIQNLFAGNICRLLAETEIDYSKLYEIRLRTGRPVCLSYEYGERLLQKTGQGPYLTTQEDLQETLEYMTG